MAYKCRLNFFSFSSNFTAQKDRNQRLPCSLTCDFLEHIKVGSGTVQHSTSVSNMALQALQFSPLNFGIVSSTILLSQGHTAVQMVNNNEQSATTVEKVFCHPISTHTLWEQTTTSSWIPALQKVCYCRDVSHSYCVVKKTLKSTT